MEPQKQLARGRKQSWTGGEGSRPRPGMSSKVTSVIFRSLYFGLSGLVWYDLFCFVSTCFVILPSGLFGSNNV